MARHAVDPSRGDVVTPEEFVACHGAQWRRQGVRPPRCPACGEDLHPYGVHSRRVTSSFHHWDGSRCPLSATPDPRYAHLRPAGWDLAAGKRLKASFCEEENLKQGYSVCHALCYGRLDSTEFVRFCKEADRRNIWSYRGLTLEIVPYILVTLADLPVNDSVGRKYPLRFGLHKPRDEAIDALWELPGSCRLVPHFADDRGRAMTKCRRPSVPDEGAESKRHDTDWMSPALVRRLRECCFRKRPR